MKIDSYSIIKQYYKDFPIAKEILLEHSKAVSSKAMGISRNMGFSREEQDFICEATYLHDIGMFLTNAPSIGCTGSQPYICHGYLGHDLLVKEGWPIHALVCERHTGTGLTVEDIKRQNLPLPLRPMEPVSLSEKIIAYADKFFSKDPGQLGFEQDLEKVRKKLLKHGEDKVRIFDDWHREFGEY